MPLDRRGKLSAVLALLFLGTQIQRLCTGSTYATYTYWSFSGVLLFLLGDVLHWTRRLNNTFMLPFVVASTTFVIFATAVMFGQRFKIVTDVLDEFPAATVYAANAWVHYAPCIIVYSYVILGDNPTVCAARVQQSADVLWVVVAIAASYFWVVDVRAAYEISADWGNDRYLTTVPILFHLFVGACYNACFFFWVNSENAGRHDTEGCII